MKICKLILIMLLISGCTKTVYETKYKIFKVPVPVQLDIPEVNCRFDGNDPTEILNNYIECVAKQKHVLDMVRRKNNACK